MGSAAASKAERFEADVLQLCRRSDIDGVEVLTLEPWRAGEVVHGFSGVIGPEIKQHSLQVDAHRHISETEFIGYLAHSCAPNCRLDMQRFELVALRDIAAGARLTIDYAETEDRLYRQFGCRCGTPICRRWITGRAEPATPEGLAFLAGPADAA